MAISLDEHWSRDLSRSRNRLRFELNTAGAYPTMFTMAYDRARQLARTALPTDSLVAIIAGQPDAWDFPFSAKYGRKRDDPFDPLEEMGVCVKASLSRWQDWLDWPYSTRDQDSPKWEHRAVRVNWDEADILLWSNIGQDIGVRPVAPVLSTLIDCERGVCVYAYDDRGMDITSLMRDEIEPLYSRFNAWLLDYDRARMAEIFDGEAK